MRVDTGVETGAEVSPFYDPMIAKVIAHGPSRDAALDRLAGALERSIVVGPRSNVAFLAALCRTRDFRAGKFDTGFIDAASCRAHRAGQGPRQCRHRFRRGQTARAGAHKADRRWYRGPWDIADSFQLGGPRTTRLPLSADGEPVVATMTGGAVTVEGQGPAPGAVAIEAGDAIYVVHHGQSDQGHAARFRGRREPMAKAAGSSARRCMARFWRFLWMRAPPSIAVNVSPY